MPADPFSHTGKVEDTLPCSHPLIPHLDLQPWKEPDSGEEDPPPPSSLAAVSALVSQLRLSLSPLAFRPQMWARSQNRVWPLAAVRLGGSVSVSDGLQTVGLFIGQL